GQLTPFDLVLLLILSNAVQNSMNGGDNSLVGGMISAVTLVAVNPLVSRITSRIRRLEQWIDGQPLVLISNGLAFQPVLKSEDITHEELMAALRRSGCEKI